MVHYVWQFMFITGFATFSGIYAQPQVPISKKLTVDQVFKAHPAAKPGETPTANAQTKNNLPVAYGQGSSSVFPSFIKKLKPAVNHPAGGTVFPDDPALSNLLTTFLNNLGKDELTRSFTTYFTRIHLLFLHELYMYLTKIYAVFNMTHIDVLVPYRDDKGVYHEGYLTEDAQQALTKKTLIINHLINIIEAQSNGAIRARFPTLPPHLATYAGNMLMKHDYGADITLLMDQSELFLVTDPKLQELIKPDVTAMRDGYLSIFADYLKFFNQYTQTLHQNDTSKGYTGINKFAQHAQKIAQLMEQYAHVEDPALKTTIQQNKAVVSTKKIEWLRSLPKLDPPLFFYDAGTMRGLKIIPALANSLPKNVQSVPPPAKIVDAANKGTFYKPKFGPETTTQLAFFDQGRLYVNIPTMQYIYTQELLPQPKWLNSVEGVMKMLQACLGDFSALFDPVFAQEAILDPCLQCIIRNGAIKAGLVSGPDESCKACSAFIDAIKKKIAEEQAQAEVPPLTMPSDDSNTLGTNP